MALFAFDRDEKIVAVLDQTNKANCQYWNAKIKRVLNGEHTLTLTVDYSHPDAKNIVEFGYIAVQNKYKQWELFLITEIDQKHDSQLVMDITAEASWVELDGIIIESALFDRKNVTDVLPSLLTGSRWQVGTNMQNTTINDLTIKNQSILSALQDFRDRWAVELNFYITIAGNAISGRYVEAYTQKGSWKGKRFEWTKDLNSIQRKIDAKSLKTALIGIGKQETITNQDGTQTQTTMDFKNVVWVKANGDPADKPSGQNWVGDPDSLAIYGKPLDGSINKKHIMGTFTDSQADTDVLLLQHTWAQLQKLKEPAITYTMKTLDLYKILNIDFESVDLGDTVAVIDHDLGVQIQARVIEQDENLDYPEQDESILGNALASFTGINKETGTMQALTQQINATGAIDPSWINTEFNFARDALRAGNGTVIINQGDGILIVDDPVNPQKAIKLVGGQIALANTRDLVTGEFNWRNFGTGEGWLASLISVGKLSFDDAQGGVLTLGHRVIGFADRTTVIVKDFKGKNAGDTDTTKQLLYLTSLTTEDVPSAEITTQNYLDIAVPTDGASMQHSLTNDQTFSVRYIRDTLNGNTVNLNNYWNEIKAMAGATNRAQGKLPTISSGTLTNGVNITDGTVSTYGYEASGNGVAKQLTVDLGAVYNDIDSINIVHYYADARTFHGTKTEISTDNVTWTTLYDSAVSGEYVETSAGKTFTTNTGAVVGTRIQYMPKFTVDKTITTQVQFIVYGLQGMPFILKPFNFTTGFWDVGKAVTYDGVASGQVTMTLSTGLSDYIRTSDNQLWFSILATNAVAKNATLTFGIDYVEISYTTFQPAIDPIYQDGVLEVWTDVNKDGQEDMVGRIDVEGAYFPQLSCDDIVGNVVKRLMVAPSDIYFDATLGDDNNDGLGWATAKKNLQIYINSLPKGLNGWTLNIHIRGTYYTGLNITGFSNGVFTIRGDSGNHAKVYGRTYIVQNSAYVYYEYVDFYGTNETNGNPCIMAMYNSYLTMWVCKIYGSNTATHGWWLEGTNTRLDNCHCYGIIDRNVYAFEGSIVSILSCFGTGSVAVLAEKGAIVIGDGTRWAGSVVRWNSGIIGAPNYSNTTQWLQDNWSSINYGEATPPVPPEVTISRTASSGDNWASTGFWTNDEVKQGSWGYGTRTGLWYFDLAEIKGKTVVHADITFTRYNHGNAGARTAYLITHRYSSRGARQNSPPVSSVGATVGIAINQTVTVDITTMVHYNIANGIDNSVGMYSTTGSADYMSVSPYATMRITYR